MPSPKKPNNLPKAKGKGKEIHTPSGKDAARALKSQTSYNRLATGRFASKNNSTTKFKHRTGDVHIHDDAAALYQNMHSHSDFKRELDNHIAKISSVNKHPGKSPEQKMREKQQHSSNFMRRIGHMINNHPSGHQLITVDGEDIDFSTMSKEERKAFIRNNLGSAMKNAALLGLSLFDQGAGSVVTDHLQPRDNRGEWRKNIKEDNSKMQGESHKDDAIELAQQLREKNR